MKHRLAIRVASLGQSLRACFPMARAMGYRGVQLDAIASSLDLSELSSSGARELRHLVTREELSLASMWLQLPPESLMVQSRLDRTLWELDRAMRAAATLGAEGLCVGLGRLPAVRAAKAGRREISPQQAGLILIPEPTPPQQDDAQDQAEDDGAWNALEQVVREIAHSADRYGVMLAFESELSSLASLQRLLELSSCPWFGWNLDPVSVLRDAWDLEKALDVLGHCLRHVRGRDAVRGNAGRTQPAAIGAGGTDWRQLLGLLDAGAFHGWITVDSIDLPDRSGQARAAAERLGSL